MVDFQKRVEGPKKVTSAKPPKVLEKKGEDEETKSLLPKGVNKKLFLYLELISLLQHLSNMFSKKQPKTINKTPILNDLKTIQGTLKTLMEKDLSQDMGFLNVFAFNWLKFLKDYSFHPLTNLEKVKKLQIFVNEIQYFPKDQEFSLGYYLSEFAGYKWIPFPYMEMLKNLHLDHQKDSENSQLKKWSDLLEEITTTESNSSNS